MDQFQNTIRVTNSCFLPALKPPLVGGLCLVCEKAPADRGFLNKTDETLMKLITRSDLQTLSLAELYALYQRLNQRLARSAKDSSLRRNCLASLETIEREILSRETEGYADVDISLELDQRPGY